MSDPPFFILFIFNYVYLKNHILLESIAQLIKNKYLAYGEKKTQTKLYFKEALGFEAGFSSYAIY